MLQIENVFWIESQGSDCVKGRGYVRWTILVEESVIDDERISVM